jgi:hypothetical protein
MQVYDNVLKPEEHALILNMCKKSNYKHGVYDIKEKGPSGLDCQLDPHSYPTDILLDKVYELKPELQGKLIRVNINYFVPREVPYFHIDDSEGTTVIYYPSDSYDEDEGGETQLLAPDDIIYGIRPRPNRFLFFKSDIRHRATSYRSSVRFTIAIKFRG